MKEILKNIVKYLIHYHFFLRIAIFLKYNYKINNYKLDKTNLTKDDLIHFMRTCLLALRRSNPDLNSAVGKSKGLLVSCETICSTGLFIIPFFIGNTPFLVGYC